MKKAFCIILAIMVLTVSCFAATDNQSEEEENEDIIFGSTPLRSVPPDNYNTKAHNPFVSGIGEDNITYSWQSNRSDIYIYFSSANSITFVTLQPSLITMYKDGVATGTSFSCKEPLIVNGVTYYAYGYPTNSSSSRARFSNCAYYNNYSEGLQTIPVAFEDSGFTVNFDIPPGNVAFVAYSVDLFGFDITTTMPEQSTLFQTGSQVTPWIGSNQRYGYLASRDMTNFEGALVPWEKDGKVSIVGTTDAAIWSSHGGHYASNQYFVLVNPAYYGATDNGPYEFLSNNSVHVSATGVQSVTIYALDSQMQINPSGGIVVDTTQLPDPWTGVVDINTGEITWTDPDGGHTNPSNGGGNLPVSNSGTFLDFLKGLVQSIIKVFEPAHDAIQSLASAVTNFGGWVMALYTWLPGPVLSLLTSAITVAIIIGVIKVFI